MRVALGLALSVLRENHPARYRYPSNARGALCHSVDLAASSATNAQRLPHGMLRNPSFKGRLVSES